VYTCLFGARGHDLRGPLRAGAPDAELSDRLRSIWGMRRDRYSERRTAATAGRAKVEMSHIGG
jgi:cyclic pyranopterin phosphate synthase